MTESTPIVAEQVFDAPISTVWKAITEPGQMRQWFFETMQDFEPRVGFETEFVVHVNDKDFPHAWKIIDVEDERKIVYDWRYTGFPGESTVTWELMEAENGTRLVLTHAGGETFDLGEPEFGRESCQAGWDYFICQSLKGYLDR